MAYEPALGPIDWASIPGIDKIDEIIIGGETGPGARAMNPSWVDSTYDFCKGAGKHFHFKQWGPIAEKHYNVQQEMGWAPEGLNPKRVYSNRVHDGWYGEWRKRNG